MNDRMMHEHLIIDLVDKSPRDALATLLDEITALLQGYFPHYTGVYVYLLEGETLVLSSYRGRPTEHTRIPIGKGICGRAARIKETVIVDDVNTDAEYIACSLQTRSEIVVPILRGDQVLGEIDIDSDTPTAFTEQDHMFLEQVAQHLAPKFA